MDRRDFLGVAVLTAGAGLSSGAALIRHAQSNAARSPALNPAWCGTDPATLAQWAAQPRAPRLRPYVDPLPIPAVLRPAAGHDAPLPISMRECVQRVHTDLPPTRLWGYNGAWPGPTIEARSGEAFSVAWSNALPAQHFLPIDPSIHGAHNVPPSRTVVHVHGARVLPDSDGYPDAWYTAQGQTGSAYRPGPCRYPNEQPAQTLWYHDHALGITRVNVYAGLAGMYLIRDAQEQALQLPRGRYEIPLLLQDRQFYADGSLCYPAAVHGTHPIWQQEFFGDVVCVNGKAMPYLEVEPRKYRFRIVNGSNSRFYHLSLLPCDRAGEPKGRAADAPPFRQIGSDGGLLPAPLSLHYLLMAPGERFDVVIDFSDCRGGMFALSNDAPAPYTRGGETPAPQVMQFRVVRTLSAPDRSTLPVSLVPFEPLNPNTAVRERILPLVEMDRASDGYTEIGLLGGKHWFDPITENPRANSTEIWSFANTTGDVHPIHIHLVRFQVLNRQAFDVATYQQSGKLVFNGIPIAAESNERPAWKDTVKSYAGYVTRVIARFDLPSGANPTPGQQFRYVWHCHMLEHEDNEMMRPYIVQT